MASGSGVIDPRGELNNIVSSAQNLFTLVQRQQGMLETVHRANDELFNKRHSEHEASKAEITRLRAELHHERRSNAELHTTKARLERENSELYNRNIADAVEQILRDLKAVK